jgi:hypothetical protein
MSKFEEDIKTVINAFVGGCIGETMEANKDTVEKLRAMATDKHFFDKLDFAQHQFITIVTEIINVPEQKNVYIVQFIISGLYEHYFEKLMEKTEGSACCADKSRFIKNMTLRALKETVNLSLFEDYSKWEQITENKEKQAYWSPKTIIDTDKAMELFWDWYLLRS